jgi:hypothetical protein
MFGLSAFQAAYSWAVGVYDVIADRATDAPPAAASAPPNTIADFLARAWAGALLSPKSVGFTTDATAVSKCDPKSTGATLRIGAAIAFTTELKSPMLHPFVGHAGSQSREISSTASQRVAPKIKITLSSVLCFPPRADGGSFDEVFKAVLQVDDPVFQCSRQGLDFVLGLALLRLPKDHHREAHEGGPHQERED